MKTVIAVSLALVVTATAAAEPNPGRSKAQDLGLIPGGGLNVDNPKRAVPWARAGTSGRPRRGTRSAVTFLRRRRSGA
jgi:hypothetical protein